jgi:DNA-binding NarL/FixJ family response regulator
VYDGGAEINPGIALQVRYYFKPQKISTPLSKRETEVLQFLADCVSYKMITDKLLLSFNTVNTHVKHIY